jgi:hypothetical protein
VDVDMSDFDTEDLIEELKNRDQYDNAEMPKSLLFKIWQNRREGKPYDAELDQLIYSVLGKVI